MKKGTLKKKLGCFFAVSVIIFGAGLFFYPDLKTLYLNRCTADRISEFQTKKIPDDRTEEQDSLDIASDNVSQATEELRNMIINYNERIFTEGQAGFQDAWSVTQSPDILDGQDDMLFGYIEIPAMDVTLPIYIGASTDHMAKGAAVLGETSIPIGGYNTNSVIAGHRGYRGAPYFRDIEELSIGDAVYITNPWETLTYRVESIDIIRPDDSDKVKIQEGKDMVTILTCHPYRSNGKYRYVVYCVRDENLAEGNREPGAVEEYITASDGNMYESSQNDIKTENYFRKCCAVVIVIIVCISFTLQILRNKKKGET